MTDETPAFAPGFGSPTRVHEGTFASGPVENIQNLPKEPSTDLRAWRIARGLSQFQAAVHTGLSLSTWIRWETKGVPELKRARLREMLK